MSKMKISAWGNYPKVINRIDKIYRAQDFKHGIITGKLRSYGDQALVDNGGLYSLIQNNRVLNFDTTSGAIECEAGLTLDNLMQICIPKGWMPLILPGTKYVTLGGAIANDIHGKNHHLKGSFKVSVLSFKIQLADNSIVECNRAENTELFDANFGASGLLGVIRTVKLQLIKVKSTFIKSKIHKVGSLNEMIETLEQDADKEFSVAWLDTLNKKSLGKGVVSSGDYLETTHFLKEKLIVHDSKQINLPLNLPKYALNKYTTNLLNKAIEFSLTRSHEYVHYNGYFFPLDKINNWNRGYGNNGFIQYQFVVPQENALEAIEQVLSRILESDCRPFLNVLKKMGGGNGYLSFPINGYTLALDFALNRKVIPLVRALNKIVNDFKGRVYLAKDALLSAEMFNSMYGKELDKWRSIKEKFDSKHKFHSSQSLRIGLTNR